MKIHRIGADKFYFEASWIEDGKVIFSSKNYPTLVECEKVALRFLKDETRWDGFK